MPKNPETAPAEATPAPVVDPDAITEAVKAAVVEAVTHTTAAPAERDAAEEVARPIARAELERIAALFAPDRRAPFQKLPIDELQQYELLHVLARDLAERQK